MVDPAVAKEAPLPVDRTLARLGSLDVNDCAVVGRTFTSSPSESDSLELKNVGIESFRTGETFRVPEVERWTDGRDDMPLLWDAAVDSAREEPLVVDMPVERADDAAVLEILRNKASSSAGVWRLIGGVGAFFRSCN